MRRSSASRGELDKRISGNQTLAIGGGPLPTRAPRLPAGLDRVWLTTGYSDGGVVWAIAAQGRRDEFPHLKAS